MNCYYVMVSTRQLQLISQRVQAVFAHCHAHCRALTVNLKKGIFKILFYNSHASVGDREYTIILFISIIFCQQYMYLTILMTERGGAIFFCGILAPPQCPPSLDATILKGHSMSNHPMP